MKENIQRFSHFLSGMVMPNIAVSVAWGFITALFIPTGWVLNETLTQMITPVQRFLLPTLIAYTGGKMVYGVQGGVAGAAATIGIPAGTKDPVFIGVMTAGPLDGWLMKKVDGLFARKISTGFGILVNSFSAGILDALLAVFGCLTIKPLCVSTKDVLVICADFLAGRNFLPLMSLFVESTRVLFLNNAINRGVFTPLGVGWVAEAGKSIFFLIEANPGPGLGLLPAYSFFGKGAARSSAPNAAIIRLLGGICEIYLPYVLTNPLTVLAMVAGGVSDVLINSIFNSDLISVVSPGSTIAILGMCAKDNYIGVTLDVVIAAVVSSIIAAFILKLSNESTNDNALEEASAVVSSMGNKARGARPAGTIGEVVLACDAGMGSSAMGATTLTKKLNVARMRIAVEHFALDDAPKDAQVTVTHKPLVERAETRCPDALTFLVTNFTGGKEYDEIVVQLIK